MLHLLRSDLNKSEEEILLEEKEASRQKLKSHVVLQNKIAQVLFTRDFNAVREFNDDIGLLKEMRNKSDYKNIQIDSKFATKSLDLLHNITTILQKYFNYGSE
jgi:hypothetical protein